MSAEDFPPTLPEEDEAEEPVPPEIVEEILQENEGILPGDDDFDLDGFVEAIHDIRSEAGAAELSMEDTDGEDADDPGTRWDDSDDGETADLPDGTSDDSKDDAKKSHGGVYEDTTNEFGASVHVRMEPVADMVLDKTANTKANVTDVYAIWVNGTLQWGEPLRFTVDGPAEEYDYAVFFRDASDQNVSEIHKSVRNGEEVVVDTVPNGTAVTWVQLFVPAGSFKEVRYTFGLTMTD